MNIPKLLLYICVIEWVCPTRSVIRKVTIVKSWVVMTQVGLMDKVHTTVQKENEKKHLNPTNFRVENCDDGSHLDQYTVVS